MKTSINRNYIWTKIFVNTLSQLGVKYVCISPGSRNTPLTIAFNEIKKIKKFVIVDERSSGFFATGLARKTRTPVVLATTSGTATAELYPAIIEAYQQRIPLIVCTADRPAYLRQRGTNQTINQKNLYRNHIYWYKDAGLPVISETGLKTIKKIAQKAFINSTGSMGPVHINLPFELPLEPKNYTDDIEKAIIEKIIKSGIENKPTGNNFGKSSAKLIAKVLEKISSKEKGMIIVGPSNFEQEIIEQILTLSAKTGYPVLADGAANIRFYQKRGSNIISNYSAFMRNKNFQKKYDSEIIIQFGGTPTSKILLKYFGKSKAEKYSINEFGDLKDPSKTTNKILKFTEGIFLEKINSLFSSNENEDSDWLKTFKEFDSLSVIFKKKTIDNAAFPFEAKIFYELLKEIPLKCNLFVSNSTPIRDLDYFVHGINKKLNIFSNRGASGIDGITSSALGVASISKEKTFLVTGDLAFYHDMNGLLNADKFSIPLIVILINNNGGGIFNALPVASKTQQFRDYFITPLNLDFSKFVKAYNGNFYDIQGWNDFKRKFNLALSNKKFSVIHIKTNSKKSNQIRNEYWQQVSDSIEKLLNENKN